MTLLPLTLLLATILAGPQARAQKPREPPVWPVAAERLLAADAAAYAPPDLKRMLARHRKRFMEGVNDAWNRDALDLDPADRRAAVARAARAAAMKIRKFHPFEEVIYDLGGMVHDVAALFPPDRGSLVAGGVLGSSSFLGYPAEPLASPDLLVAARLPGATPREAYDSALTMATRLLAWTWSGAGGDATVVRTYPETKGPYVVRE